MEELITKNGIDEQTTIGNWLRIWDAIQAAKSDPALAPETVDLSNLNNENENEEGDVVDDDYDASFSKMYLLSIQTVSALGEREQS